MYYVHSYEDLKTENIEGKFNTKTDLLSRFLIKFVSRGEKRLNLGNFCHTSIGL